MALKVRPYLIHIAILLVLVAVAYSNVFTNGFLLDDEFLLQKNRFITDIEYFFRIFTSSSTRGAGGSDSFYRPMQTLAYFIVYQFVGLEPAGFHLLNLILHAANGVLVYFLMIRRLSLQPAWALMAAALWTVHPIHTEAVTYMSATADPLHTLFVLLAVYTFGHHRWWSLGFFVAGLLSKESAIVTPLLIMAVLALKSKRLFNPKTYFVTWPHWVLVAVYLIARKTVLDFDDTFSFYAEPNIYTENISYRFLTFLGTLPMYLKLLLWPTGLHMERDFPVFAGWTLDPILGAVLLLLAAATIWLERAKEFRPGSTAALWFFMAHIPHTGVLLPVNSLFLEHWMYLPSIGLFAGLFLGLEKLVVKPQRLWPVVVPAVVALSVCTFRQNRVWSDAITFYEHILRYAKGTTRVFNNLGMAYAEKGLSEKAIEQYMRAVEIKDSYPQVRHNLGEEYMRLGRPQDAIKQLERAIEIDPRFYYSYKNLAVIYQDMGDMAKARYYYNMYQTLRPN